VKRPITAAEFDRRLKALIEMLPPEERMNLCNIWGDRWCVLSPDDCKRLCEMIDEIGRPGREAHYKWVNDLLADPLYHQKFFVGQLKREGFTTPGEIMIQMRDRWPHLAEKLKENTVKVWLERNRQRAKRQRAKQ